jgi:Zn-dependent protease
LTAPGGPNPSNPQRSPNGRGPSNRSTTILVGIVVLILLLGARSGTIDLGREQLIYFAVLIPSVILHEISHGAVALLFGDDTAKRAGRLTLNPIAHVDPFGTIILPAILVLTAGSAFGYAKPVPVSPRRMRDPRNHSLLTSLAGPATNIVLALVSVVLLRAFFVGRAVSGDSLFLLAAFYLGVGNVILAVFNLIPIPPLDGSAVVERVLPARLWPSYLRIRQYSMLLIFVLVFWSGGALDRIFEPALDLWYRLLR